MTNRSDILNETARWKPHRLIGLHLSKYKEPEPELAIPVPSAFRREYMYTLTMHSEWHRRLFNKREQLLRLQPASNGHDRFASSLSACPIQLSKLRPHSLPTARCHHQSGSKAGSGHAHRRRCSCFLLMY